MKQYQLNKEARWAVWLSLAYLLAWCVFAYLLPVRQGLLGFPLWFECACIFLPLGFTLLVWWVIKKIYQDIDLEADSDE